MKNIKYNLLELEDSEFLILSLALRALRTLRLGPRLSLNQDDYSIESVNYMTDMINGFREMCCDVDLLMDDPSGLIGRLIKKVDVAAGDDVYQSFAKALKYVSD